LKESVVPKWLPIQRCFKREHVRQEELYDRP
jgi:hypothetical protein